VKSWKTAGGSVAGTAGPSFSTGGTAFVATSDGQVVSLDAKTLTVKDSFTAPGKSPFNSSPSLFRSGNQDLIAVSNADGMIYLFDSSSLKNALSTTTKYVNTAANATAGAVTEYDSAAGTQWVYAAAVGPQSTDTKFATSYGPVTNGAIVAFRVEQLVGKAALQPVWISRDMTTPLAPVVANGVLFALASGAQSGKSAVLYALDAATGKELWNSGVTITSHASANAGMAVSAGQLYFGTADGTLWTFGYYTEH
jgi:outer membrane protein assembly factor BamB